jgi:hypothetical protein
MLSSHLVSGKHSPCVESIFIEIAATDAQQPHKFDRLPAAFIEHAPAVE